MLSEGVLRTAKELVRQSQNRSCQPNVLAAQILKLERVTALRTDKPLSDIIALREELEAHIGHRYVLDAITARVLDALDGKSDSRVKIENALDALVEQLSDSEGELVEQLSSCVIPNDRVMIVAEEEGGVIENALLEAAEVQIAESTGGDDVISVTVVKLLPDDDGIAEEMVERLGTAKGLKARLVSDVQLTEVMASCGKVLLSGVAMDVDEGVACIPGSGLVCGVANRMRVAVVLGVSKFRMMPVGSGCVTAMATQHRYPGTIWDYNEARDDERREAVAMVAPMFDMIGMTKFEMIVTELGGCPPDYVVNLIPAYEKTEGEGDEHVEEQPRE